MYEVRPQYRSKVPKPEATMRVIRSNRATLVLLVMIAAAFGSARAQTTSSDDYATERAKAATLVKQQNWLDALPLFEDLFQKNPKDAVVLEGLAQCLIAHSVTLQNPDAAGQERIRAKALLEAARQLGDHSQLLENLLDTLKNLPKNGEVNYAENSDVNAAMKAGEAAFAEKDFAEAIKNYSHALELDPKSYWAALFVGDSYFSEKEFPQAGEWYDRAAQIDPNRETAYRYHADMLTKQGDFSGARTLSIEAIVAEPYNAIPWRGLVAWANACHVKLPRVHIETGGSATPNGENKITITLDANQPAEISAVWFGYSGTRALWHQERFKKEFPQVAQYRHTLVEEADALTTAAKVAEETAGKSPNSPIAKDANIQLLLRLYHQQMIEPYVLLNSADQEILLDYPAYRAQNRAKLVQYLNEFVVPEPAKAP
jgi:tetratricopeptide (TPR) repeat protein